MTRVIALSSMLGMPVTDGLVKRALGRARNVAQRSHDAEWPAPNVIQDAACSALGVSRQDLLSTRRTARVNQARQIAIYLTRELTPLSLAQIAREFDRDHSTVLHSIRTVTGRLEPNSDTAAALDRVRKVLHTSTMAGGDSPLTDEPLHNPPGSPPAPSTPIDPNPSP
jgi:chromosomal replication initiator protein